MSFIKRSIKDSIHNASPHSRLKLALLRIILTIYYYCESSPRPQYPGGGGPLIPCGGGPPIGPRGPPGGGGGPRLGIWPGGGGIPPGGGGIAPGGGGGIPPGGGGIPPGGTAPGGGGGIPPGPLGGIGGRPDNTHTCNMSQCSELTNTTVMTTV